MIWHSLELWYVSCQLGIINVGNQFKSIDKHSQVLLYCIIMISNIRNISHVVHLFKVNTSNILTFRIRSHCRWGEIKSFQHQSLISRIPREGCVKVTRLTGNGVRTSSKQCWVVWTKIWVKYGQTTQHWVKKVISNFN